MAICVCAGTVPLCGLLAKVQRPGEAGRGKLRSDTLVLLGHLKAASRAAAGPMMRQRKMTTLARIETVVGPVRTNLHVCLEVSTGTCLQSCNG